MRRLAIRAAAVLLLLEAWARGELRLVGREPEHGAQSLESARQAVAFCLSHAAPIPGDRHPDSQQPPKHGAVKGGVVENESFAGVGDAVYEIRRHWLSADHVPPLRGLLVAAVSHHQTLGAAHILVGTELNRDAASGLGVREDHSKLPRR